MVVEKNNENTVSFIFPVTNGVMGGIQVVLINLISELVKKESLTVCLYDYSEGIVKKKLDRLGVTGFDFIALDGFDSIIPNRGNETFVLFGFQFYFYPFYFKEDKGVKILNWNVFYPQLDQISNVSRFKIPFLRTHILKKLLRNNSLLFMEGNGVNGIFEEIGETSDNVVLPVPVDMNLNYSKPLVYKDKLKVGYIGRAVDWKIKPVKKIFEDLISLGVDFELLVFTDDIERFRAKFTEIENKRIAYYSGKFGDELNDLIRHVNLGFSMGISALDFAKNGIPTILSDYSFDDFPLDYKYKWLFNSSFGNLGHDVNGKHFSNCKRSNLEDMLSDLKHSSHEISLYCYNYAVINHSVQEVANRLLEHVSKTQLTPHDLSSTWFEFKSRCTYLKKRYFSLKNNENDIWAN